ncbi:unnamed protein product [Rhizophagus irregularis]|nr:unnamed protein product [Rhizophagus irregularis]
MATILFNNIETIPIPYISPNNTSIHNPNGVCDTILKTTLWENYMISFAIVTIHLKPIGFNYKILLYGRKFTEIKLVDLVELNLKNTKDYLQAAKSFIELPEVQAYFNNYIIPIHADFPGKLYIRKAIVKKLEFLDLMYRRVFGMKKKVGRNIKAMENQFTVIFNSFRLTTS